MACFKLLLRLAFSLFKNFPPVPGGHMLSRGLKVVLQLFTVQGFTTVLSRL